MQIGKLGLFIILFAFIVLMIAALALGVPAIGAALHDFGVNTLGPGVLGGLTTVVCTPLAWGAETLLYGVVVWVAITLVVSLLWILVFKRVWNVTKAKLGYGQTVRASTTTPIPTMTGPQTVIVKEVPVATTETKEKADE